MCITSGEYAHEKKKCDEILVGYARTTYNNDGQPTRTNKQISRERWRAFRTRIYYDICERFPTAGNEGGDTTLGIKILDGHPSWTNKKISRYCRERVRGARYISENWRRFGIWYYSADVFPRTGQRMTDGVLFMHVYYDIYERYLQDWLWQCTSVRATPLKSQPHHHLSRPYVYRSLKLSPYRCYVGSLPTLSC